MKKHIFLFRHGQTDWNIEGRIQGHIDVPLNETGRVQAETLAATMKAHNLDIIISSDLSRAHETAMIIGVHCDIPIHTHPALREINAGQTQGKLKKECATLWSYFANIDPRYDHVGFPQGETKKEAAERIISWLKEYCATTPHTRIGISSHGFILKLLLRELGHYRDEPLTNSELIIIEYELE